MPTRFTDLPSQRNYRLHAKYLRKAQASKGKANRRRALSRAQTYLRRAQCLRPKEAVQLTAIADAVLSLTFAPTLLDPPQILSREEVTFGKYLYRRPGWDKWSPVEVHEGRGDFQGRKMIRFFTDTIPGQLKDVPADAQFEHQPDSLEIPSRKH